ncbi:hypothetical protein E2542_SST28898 [Spatholobus suberectus]|nr:hypothetical protein E2542_SST28898 [Spatholobus suberectus]
MVQGLVEVSSGDSFMAMSAGSCQVQGLDGKRVLAAVGRHGSNRGEEVLQVRARLTFKLLIDGLIMLLSVVGSEAANLMGSVLNYGVWLSGEHVVSFWPAGFTGMLRDQGMSVLREENQRVSAVVSESVDTSLACVVRTWVLMHSGSMK